MRYLILLAIFAVSFSSCNLFGGKRVKGNGKVITQDKKLSGFTKIDAEGAVDLHLKQDAATSVSVQTDENLMEYLDIKVDGSTLVIETKNGYNLDPTKEVAVYVSASEFEDIEISGASNVYTEGVINGNKLELHASGASKIVMDVKAASLESELSGASRLQLKGSAQKFSVDASGASIISCLDLTTSDANLDLSGASKAEVSVEKQLNVEASGASHVKYRGNANINQQSSGASSVEKVN